MSEVSLQLLLLYGIIPSRFFFAMNFFFLFSYGKGLYFIDLKSVFFLNNNFFFTFFYKKKSIFFLFDSQHLQGTVRPHQIN